MPMTDLVVTPLMTLLLTARPLFRNIDNDVDRDPNLEELQTMENAITVWLSAHPEQKNARAALAAFFDDVYSGHFSGLDPIIGRPMMDGLIDAVRATHPAEWAAAANQFELAP